MTTTTKTKPHVADLQALDACTEAIQWAATQPDAETAWANCQRGDWMLWLCGTLSGPPESDARKTLVMCACECARLALPSFEKRQPDDSRPRACIETAERWARDEATIEQLREARAYAAAYDAASAAAYSAAYVAAYDAASDAAYAAAYAAASDAASDAAYAARSTTLAHCADIVRKHYPAAPVLEAAP